MEQDNEPRLMSERTLLSHFLNGVSSKFDHMSTTIRHKDLFPTLVQT